MEVLLAGMNVDCDVLEALAARAGDDEEARTLREGLTPETISAAYARISRDPMPVDELRKVSRQEVARARKSNEVIVFGLGHASVAEHAVFNLDVKGLSRLAAEFLEHFRLCSFTEKSQRYIRLEGGYVVPPEIEGASLERDFRDLMEIQTRGYETLYRALAERLPSKYPAMAQKSEGMRTLDGWAKEDARYAMGLACETQLGMTSNARNLERIIQKALCHSSLEVKELGSRLLEALRGVAPSLIKYTEPELYHTIGLPRFLERVRESAVSGMAGAAAKAGCTLLSWDPEGEARVFAALAHQEGAGSWERCLEWAKGLGEEDRRDLWAGLARELLHYQSLPRALEYLDFTFECVMSASCFAQFKRHRMGTMTTAAYDSSLGVTVPPMVEEVGMRSLLLDVAAVSARLAEKVAEKAPAAAPYCLTNAHRRRVLAKFNLRELHHFSRLRMDAHAQWDIRQLASDMVSRARERCPVLGMLLCGKDSFENARDNLVGTYGPGEEPVRR